MSDINTLLEQIENAVYGEEVRSAIHDAIELCYDNRSSETLIEQPYFAVRAEASDDEGTFASGENADLTAYEIISTMSDGFVPVLMVKNHSSDVYNINYKYLFHRSYYSGGTDARKVYFYGKGSPIDEYLNQGSVKVLSIDDNGHIEYVEQSEILPYIQS